MESINIIENLCKTKEKINVRIEGVNEIFQSVFLKLHEKNGKRFIEIRNFAPYSGDTYIKTVKKMQCEFLVNNKPHYFYTHHISTIHTDSITVHMIEFPQNIYQHQRRRFFRVSPSDGNPVQCKIGIPDPATGTLQYFTDIHVTDISIGGLLIANGICGINWELNQEIPDIRIILGSGKTPMTFKGVVRRISKVADVHGETIGIEFRDVHFDDEAKLSQYIAKRLQEIHEERLNPARNIHPKIKTVKFA